MDAYRRFAAGSIAKRRRPRRSRRRLLTLTAWAAAAMLVATATLTRPVAQGGSLNGHPVRFDGGGGLVSWHTQSGAYDHVMAIAWDFLLNRVPTAGNGYKYYYLYSAMVPSDLTPTARNNNPGSMFPNFVDSALRYYPYSGNTAVANLARDVLSHYLTHGRTPSNWPWPNVPFATGENGNPDHRGDSSVDGVATWFNPTRSA
jgi:hypothetical protein